MINLSQNRFKNVFYLSINMIISRVTFLIVTLAVIEWNAEKGDVKLSATGM